MKVLKSGVTLNVLGQHDADMDDVVSEATNFIAACYGSRTKGDVSEIRYTIWVSKMANTKITSAPKLKYLPPTNASLSMCDVRTTKQPYGKVPCLLIHLRWILCSMAGHVEKITTQLCVPSCYQPMCHLFQLMFFR